MFFFHFPGMARAFRLMISKKEALSKDLVHAATRHSQEMEAWRFSEVLTRSSAGRFQDQDLRCISLEDFGNMLGRWPIDIRSALQDVVCCGHSFYRPVYWLQDLQSKVSEARQEERPAATAFGGPGGDSRIFIDEDFLVGAMFCFLFFFANLYNPILT